MKTDPKALIGTRRTFSGKLRVCAHTISFWYDISQLGEPSPNSKHALEQEAARRSKEMITDDYVAGELNCVVNNDKEIRGWWFIDDCGNS